MKYTIFVEIEEQYFNRTLHKELTMKSQENQPTKV